MAKTVTTFVKDPDMERIVKRHVYKKTHRTTHLTMVITAVLTTAMYAAYVLRTGILSPAQTACMILCVALICVTADNIGMCIATRNMAKADSVTVMDGLLAVKYTKPQLPFMVKKNIVLHERDIMNTADITDVSHNKDMQRIELTGAYTKCKWYTDHKEEQTVTGTLYIYDCYPETEDMLMLITKIRMNTR